MKLPVKLLVAAALTLGVAACGPSGNKSESSGGKPVTLFQWEDYMDPPFYADYQKTYNEKPNVAIFACPVSEGWKQSQHDTSPLEKR